MNMQDRTTERHREVPPMKTPLVIKLIMAALIFMVAAIYAAILINGQYVNTTNPNDPILKRLGITPRADLIAEEYTKANIEAISDDIRIQMTFHIPALAQIDPKRMSELIQDNSKFHYSEAQRIRGETYEVTATAQVDIRIDESATNVGEVAGILPFLFVVDRNNRQVNEYYIQRAEAYFGSNLTTVSKETSK